MCVIINKSADVELSADDLQKAVDRNPDGLGYTYYSVKKGWVIDKIIAPNESDIAKVSKLLHKKTAIVHARIATSGRVNTANCHPFANKDYILFHNGIVGNLNGVSDRKSDTALLFDIIKRMPFETASNLLSRLSQNTGSKFVYVHRATNKYYKYGKFENYAGLECSNLYFTRPSIQHPKLLPPTTEYSNLFPMEWVDWAYDNYYISNDDDLLIIDQRFSEEKVLKSFDTFKDFVRQEYDSWLSLTSPSTKYM